MTKGGDTDAATAKSAPHPDQVDASRPVPPEQAVPPDQVIPSEKAFPPEQAEPSDAELLAAHVSGSPHAFTTLVARHRNRMWAIALAHHA